MSKTHRVNIVATGAVGVGKSVVLHEIHRTLTALGVPVSYADEGAAQSERRTVSMDVVLRNCKEAGLEVILYERHGSHHSFRPQHVIALATVNEHRAHHSVPSLTWEQLEQESGLKEGALREATYILEALDAAGLRIVRGEKE